MSTITNEEETDRALVSALLAHKIQPYSTTLVVMPPSGAVPAAGVTFDPPNQATFFNAAQAFPTTNVKWQSIIKRWDSSSISDEASCVVLILAPKNHMSKVIFTPMSDMEASSDDPRTELDSHANTF